MIFDQIEFHNVEELEKTEKGYKMSRLPRNVAEKLDCGICSKTSFLSTGVELRFRMPENEVKLYLRVNQEVEAQVAYIYFGSFQGGWNCSSAVIGTEETVITIRYPENLEVLVNVAKENNLPFNPYLVRVLLPYGTCYYMGKEGKTEVPHVEDVPEERYLAYGSSITHGSLALGTPSTYPFRIAQHMRCDYINQGYAGSAFIEKPMAEYIVSRKDWTFASVELGINLLGKTLTDGEFEDRVKEFLQILAADGRKVFVTDIFTYLGEPQERGEVFRAIVRKYAEANGLIYTPGKEILSQRTHISADLVHPSVEGIRDIAENWGNIMMSYGMEKENL